MIPRAEQDERTRLRCRALIDFASGNVALGGGALILSHVVQLGFEPK